MTSFHQPVIGKRGGVALRGGIMLSDEAGNGLMISIDVRRDQKWSDAHAAMAREVADILCGKPAEVLP